MTYYFKQTDRNNEEILGYVSYDNYYPENNHPTIYLEEISCEEFMSLFASFDSIEEA